MHLSRHRDKANRGLASQPMSTTIQQIEFELEKAERGMAMPYDAERVMQLRSMLREARKQKLSESRPRSRPRSIASVRCRSTRCGGNGGWCSDECPPAV